MRDVSELMRTRAWCFWLDQSHPDPDMSGKARFFRVSIVIQNERGHFPTGGKNLQAPWYWDEETCVAQNAKRGVTKEMAFEIVSSSMAR